MPPRAANRRVGRPRRSVDSQASETSPTDPTQSPLPRLQKPQLPKLKGTPSSRRQYTYGAGEEPLPARAGHRMRQDEELDLGNAVGNLLEQQEEEDMREMPPPPPPVQPAQQEDELAAAHVPARLSSKAPEGFAPNVYEALRGPRNGRLAAANSQPDDVSLRSFATESDIFGDAIISSPPHITPQLEPIPEPQAQPRPRERLSNRRATCEPGASNLSTEPARDLSDERISSLRRAGLATANGPSKTLPQTLDENPRTSRQEARARTQPEPRPIPRLDPPGNTGNRVKLVTATKRPQLFHSDYSEQDDEIQNSIRLEDQLSEQQNSSPRAQSMSPWRQGWITIKKFSPLKSLQHQDDEDDEDEDEEIEVEEGSVVNSGPREPVLEPREWPRFLTLSFYTEAILRFMDLINDHVTLMLIRIGEAAQATSKSVSRINLWIPFLILLLAVSGSWLALSAHNNDAYTLPSWDLSETLKHIHIPSIPSFSLPFGGWGNNQPGLIDLSPEELQHLPREIREMLRKIDHEFSQFTDASRLQTDEIKAIKDSLPDMVYMEKRNGKPHVPDAFWSPFRSRLTDDSTVLKHFVSGTLKDPTLTSKLTTSAKDMESRLERKFTDQWDHWVADNKDKVNSGKQNGMLVTKDEFAKHLEDFTNNRHDVRAALNQIKPNVQAFVREALKEAQNSHMSSAAITALIQETVRKEVANIQLDTHAKSEMSKNWHLLRKNINWFNPASGATINAGQSSKTWKPVPEKKGAFWSIFTADPPENMVALEPWFEEGDCWCAAHDKNARGNLHGAKLVVQLGKMVVPQHIVLEHIHASATTDPGARPRIIEVYGNYGHDEVLRERLLGFANDRNFKPNTTTPDEAKDHDSSLLGWQFVMIGRFEYQEGTDGVHVHRLSEQLEAMQAETDEVAIRVVANDGNLDHTCFYRVRMFGQPKE